MYRVRLAMEHKSSLLQLHVLFRHGDRNPELRTMYPTDPHLNDPYYPDGLGALTLKGKTQAYDIGKYLRSTYNDFLGNIVTPEVMDAWSTSSPRTKVSMLATLAGLWPPAPSEIWNEALMWQPIPFKYIPMENDNILRFPLIYCPKYREVYREAIQNTEMQEYLLNHKNLIDYINTNSGLDCKTTIDLFKLYFGLYAEEQTGRTLPEWTKKIYPDFLTEASIFEYKFQTCTDALKRKSNGPLLQKIICDAKAKIEGTLEPKDRKMYLYSAHEYNIAHMLASLNLYKGHIPPYAAFLILELHKINNQYGFKILYQDYTTLQPQVLVLPGCEEFCPFDKFIELTKHILPVDNEEF